MPGDHAKFSPSAAKRWKRCPASVRETETLPSPDSEASLRGTACHWAFAEGLMNGELPPLGAKAPNDIVLDVELLEIAGEGVGWVKGYLALAEGKCSLMVEERIQIGHPYFDLPPDLFYGTCDCLILAPNELVVFDLKSGWVDVQAEENEQLIAYATGACEELGWLWEQIRLVIVQPKQGEAKEWVITRKELQTYAEELREPIQNALSASPRYAPSEEACGFCAAKAVCKKLHEQAIILAQQEFATPQEIVQRITKEQLLDLLSRADLIRGVLTAVEAHALQLLQLGQELPGWKAVEGKKNRIWRAGTEGEVAAVLGEKAYTKKLISPAQAEKIAKKAVEPFIEKPKGEPRLAPESDKRPALPAHFEAVDMTDVLA